MCCYDSCGNLVASRTAREAPAVCLRKKVTAFRSDRDRVRNYHQSVAAFYIGETCRAFKMRLHEHQQEVNSQHGPTQQVPANPREQNQGEKIGSKKI